VIDLALWINVLPRTDHHGLGRGHVGQGGLAWVGVRNPYRDRESVGCAAEEDRYCAREVEKQGRVAVGECVDIGSRRERWILRQGLGYIVVGSVDIVIFLGGGGEGSASWLRSMSESGRRTLVKTL
jgi:hypothetical protein